jgi:CHAD domain-containing protein/HD superfamily phosphodiesterase
MKTASKTTGLRYWMLRVLDECDHCAAAFAADPVHDLRVALRRCRSMADGLMAMDPDPDWKAMKKAGKRVFQSLGELRDVQIMMDWIDQLWPDKLFPDHLLPDAAESAAASEPHSPELSDSHETENAAPASGSSDHPHHNPPAYALLGILRQRETELKRAARTALEQFDRKQWRQWAKTLPLRASHIRPGNAVYKHLALERWTAARELHARAMRNRSQVALHTLRIGIKRFRYIVENFLPVEHKAWSNDLKHMQDLLGEVHDLDVLWAAALSYRVFHEEESRKAWHARIVEERTKRVDEYRQNTIGDKSLWNVWRAGLPQGKQVQELATRRMKLWAKVLDPDFPHSERVARLALELYDGLGKARLLASSSINQNGNSNGNGKGNENEERASLYVAALLHDVGKSDGEKKHHKVSRELIRTQIGLLGWTADTIERAATIARFHCGALPVPSHKALRDLLPDEQKLIIRLSAILRLANAFDSAHDGHIRRVQIEPPQTENTSRSTENAARLHARARRTNGLLRKPPTLGKNEALVISAEGYTPGSPTAQAIAAERHLLETVLRRPVVVRAANPPQRAASGMRTSAA